MIINCFPSNMALVAENKVFYASDKLAAEVAPECQNQFTDINTLRFFASIFSTNSRLENGGQLADLIQQELNSLAPQNFAYIEAAKTKGTDWQLATIEMILLKTFKSMAEEMGCDLQFKDVEFLLVSHNRGDLKPWADKDCFEQFEVYFPIRLVKQVVGGPAEIKEWERRHFSIAFKIEGHEAGLHTHSHTQVFIWLSQLSA